MRERGSGILLHITSLPSPFGIGDLGPWAHRFAQFLAEAGQRYWQILPLNPTEAIYGNSPYHSTSAFACNPQLLSPEFLVEDGLLDRKNLEVPPAFPEGRVDYQSVETFKEKLFHKIYENFKCREVPVEYERFCGKNAFWLGDFALFTALRSHFHGRVWNQWPEELRDRRPAALESAKRELQDLVEGEMLLQYLCFKQWSALKKACNEKGIQIIGDMPIYVVHDSADVWVHPDMFKLDHEKRPYAVAGVPPDYFSETGQLWGNPVYRWDFLRRGGYGWWIQRMEHNLTLFDVVRIDHFRGFLAYWEVPAEAETAINGAWVEAPAEEFFNHMTEKFPHFPIIAEDLGTITPDVWELMDHFGFPGMKVLLFAFGNDLPTNPYAPHNHQENCVVYTGTHDNNTVRGWFEKEATPEDKERLCLYVGRKIGTDEVHRELIRLAMMSTANRAIFPMQDILGLGEAARMNRPARKDGNWQWRLVPDQLDPSLTKRLLEMTRIYGRA